MKTKYIQKSDFFFFILITLGIGIFLALVCTMPSCIDETFYPSIALRLINGDSLITDEWHLSQFSSLFLYLPVRLWLAIKGSTDGIIIFLRYCFLLLQTTAAFIVYGKFRKHGIWAVFAALFFFLQAPMRVYSLSYNSLFAFFLLIVSLLLYTIYEKQHPILYIFAGFCYGAACVCNPFFCLVFPVYGIICLILFLLQKPKKKEKKAYVFSFYAKFFNKKAFAFFFVGIFTIAVIAVIFFFATGGTLSGITIHVKNLLTDAEHDVFSSPVTSFFNKLGSTCAFFTDLSYNLPFLLPVLYVAILLDKKKYTGSHRLLYLLLAFALAVFYAIAIKTSSEKPNNPEYFFWTLPFLIISTVSFLLTKKKNYPLFFCFRIFGAISAFTQYLASNLHLLAIGWVLTISCIAGIFFIKDLFAEIKAEKEETKQGLRILLQSILCIGICFNFALEVVILCYDLPQTYADQTKELTEGVYAGILIDKKVYGSHTLLQNDLSTIRERSEEDDNVLIISNLCWLQMEIDRPVAAYSAWQLSFEPERFKAYFEQNPDKQPKYIYITTVIDSNYRIGVKTAEVKAAVMKSMFNCKEEKLSRGILLTVIE